MTPRRVLYVNHASLASGAEMSLLALVTGLDRDRFVPSVLLPGDGAYADKLRHARIEVRVGELRPASLRDPSGLAVNARTIGRAASDHRADLVHANSFHAIKQVVPWALAKRVPVVGSVREIIPFTRPTLAALTSCRRIACVSRATAENIASRVSARRAERLRVVPNGVDPRAMDIDEGRDEARRAIGLDDLPRPLIGMLAPLVGWKGQPLFLDAARRLRVACGAGGFVLVGDERYAEGSFIDDLRRAADADALRGAVRFLGFRDDVPRVLRALDVVVCASIAPDPLPRAVLEAMAASRAVVGPRAGGVPEQIDHGATGLLFAPGDADDLAAAMRTLVDDPARRDALGRAAREKIEREFSIERHCSAMSALYDEVLAER